MRRDPRMRCGKNRGATEPANGGWAREHRRRRQALHRRRGRRQPSSSSSSSSLVSSAPHLHTSTLSPPSCIHYIILPPAPSTQQQHRQRTRRSKRSRGRPRQARRVDGGGDEEGEEDPLAESTFFSSLSSSRFTHSLITQRHHLAPQACADADALCPVFLSLQERGRFPASAVRSAAVHATVRCSRTRSQQLAALPAHSSQCVLPNTRFLHVISLPV